MVMRKQLLATVLLVLVALGGAGLTVASDRIQDPGSRPEVTWAADHGAQPYIDALASDLGALTTDVAALSKAGRDTLGDLQSLDVEAVRTAMDDGDAITNRIAGALARVSADQARAHSNVERWRLGPDSAAQLDAVDKAASSTVGLVGVWDALRARAAVVAGVVDDLQRHDSLVFRATTSGRQSAWADAITTMAGAGAALDEARAARDALGASSTDTLSQLIDRYAAYDSALSGLYSYFGSGGSKSGAQFETVNKQVEDAQAALPSGNEVFSLIVGEAAGSQLADALVQIEQARGDINAALEATR
jgi:hypothetical protein